MSDMKKAIDTLAALEQVLDHKVTALTDINCHYENVLNNIRSCVREEIARQKRKKSAESVAKAIDGERAVESNEGGSTRSVDPNKISSIDITDIGSLSIVADDRDEFEMDVSSLESILAAARQIRQPKTKSSAKDASSIRNPGGNLKASPNPERLEERAKRTAVDAAVKSSHNSSSRGKNNTTAPEYALLSPRARASKSISSDSKNTKNATTNTGKVKVDGLADSGKNLTLADLVTRIELLHRFAATNNSNGNWTFLPYAPPSNNPDPAIIGLYESAIMTKLLGRPWFPQSDLYEAIVASMASRSTSSSIENDQSTSNDLTVDELVTNINKLKQNFETKVKYKMQNSATESKETKRQIFELWLLARGYIKSFEALYTTKKAIDINFNDIDSYLSSIRRSPSVLPLSFHGKSYLRISSNEWLEKNDDRLNRYLKELENIVKVAAESVIGKDSLKIVIRNLKNCSENEANNSNKNRNKAMWIESLKSFKSVYSALITEATSDTNCIFIEK